MSSLFSGHSLVTGSVLSGPAPSGSQGAPEGCKASCCKSPYGHSVVRDSFPKWHKEACHCHEKRNK